MLPLHLTLSIVIPRSSVRLGFDIGLKIFMINIVIKRTDEDYFELKSFCTIGGLKMYCIRFAVILQLYLLSLSSFLFSLLLGFKAIQLRSLLHQVHEG